MEKTYRCHRLAGTSLVDRDKNTVAIHLDQLQRTVCFGHQATELPKIDIQHQPPLNGIRLSISGGTR
jgi:hypothetical protein